MKLMELCQLMKTYQLAIAIDGIEGETSIEGGQAVPVAAAAFGDCLVKEISAIDSELIVVVELPARLQKEEERKHERGAGKNPLRQADTHIKEKAGDPLHEVGLEGTFVAPYTGVPF